MALNEGLGHGFTLDDPNGANGAKFGLLECST